MAAKLDWRPAEVKRGLSREMGRRMVEVERLMRVGYQVNVGQSYPPASLPHQFPRRRSGRLQLGVRTNVNAVGNGDKIRLTMSNVATSDRGFPYPAALESGTIKMAPRPHLRKTLNEMLDLIKQLLLAALR